MSFARFSRRGFLASAGLGAGLVPLLSPRRGDAATGIKRLVVIGVPNGYTNDYVPEVVAGEPGGWRARAVEFSPLKPLEPFRDKLLVLGGINIQNGIDTARQVKNSPTASIGGHAILPFLLTGAKGVAGPAIPDGWNLTAAHPSVDQYVATHMPGAKDRPFPSLVLRPVKLNAAGYGSNPLSYNGKTVDGRTHNAPTIRENPMTLFDDLFAGKVASAEMDRLRARKKSLLDFTAGHLRQLQSRVGKDDRERLGDHMVGIERIEKQLAASVASCQPPGRIAAGAWADVEMNPKMNLVLSAHVEMTVAALACDLTRVVSHNWCSSNNNTIVFPWLADRIPSLNDNWTGSNNGGSGNPFRNHHAIAHNEGVLKREKNLTDQYFIEGYAQLIKRLAETKDPDGKPLLDSTLVLFANMQRTGGGHQVDNLIWFVAGNCDGYFKTGRYLPWVSGQSGKTAPTNGVLAALVNATGCPSVEHFGDPAYGGELATLRT
jgi:hypothetical protein